MALAKMLIIPRIRYEKLWCNDSGRALWMRCWRRDGRRILAATGDKAARYTAVTASCPEYYVDLRDAHFAIGEASRVN
jgi:hypothetical protein